MNISYKRKASAPNSLRISSGFTALPRDLDIFWPSSPRMRPWFTNLKKGSGVETWPRSKSTLCQKRA